MKQSSIFLILLFVSIAFKGIAQASAPADFFAGKWEITVSGTPNGDVKFVTELVRQEGKLTGEMVNGADPSGKRTFTKIEESADKLVLYFDSSQAGEIAINLMKVDDDNLKGTLMESFETTAKRIKE